MIQSILNKAQAEKQAQAGITVYPTEEILGSMKSVKDFGAFQAKHKVDLQTVSASFLLDYCQTVTFTPEELKAFRLGLECFTKFFEASESDTENYILQAENKNNKSAG